MYMPGDEPDLRLLVVFSVADLDTVRVFAESNKIKYDITSAPRDTWQSVTADALLQLRTEVAVEMLTGAQDTKRLPFGRHLSDIRRALADLDSLPFWLAVDLDDTGIRRPAYGTDLCFNGAAR